MGQGKRRQFLDPYFGENKTMLHTLIEKDELFDKPQNVYLGAFVAMQVKPIVLVDAINYDKIMVIGFDDKERFPEYLKSYEETVFETDFSIHNVMIISIDVGMSLIVHIEKSEVEKSIEWAEYKGLKMKTSDSAPERIANYDLTGVKCVCDNN